MKMGWFKVIKKDVPDPIDFEEPLRDKMETELMEIMDQYYTKLGAITEDPVATEHEQRSLNLRIDQKSTQEIWDITMELVRIHENRMNTLRGNDTNVNINSTKGRTEFSEEHDVELNILTALFNLTQDWERRLNQSGGK